jgi:hypothetical protein
MTHPSVARALDGVYLAECFWPGVSQRALLAAAGNTAQQPSPARCLELILVPADEIVLALYQAPSAAAVTAASRRAGLPSERVVDALRIAPLPPGPRRQPGAAVHNPSEGGTSR